MLARIRINAFRIELAGGVYEDLLSFAAASIEAEAAVGNAIYMLPSFYNHDCGKFFFHFLLVSTVLYVVHCTSFIMIISRTGEEHCYGPSISLWNRIRAC